MRESFVPRMSSLCQISSRKAGPCQTEIIINNSNPSQILHTSYILWNFAKNALVKKNRTLNTSDTKYAGRGIHKALGGPICVFCMIDLCIMAEKFPKIVGTWIFLESCKETSTLSVDLFCGRWIHLVAQKSKFKIWI